MRGGNARATAKKRSLAYAGPAGLVLTVVGLTAATARRPALASTLAASPARVLHGKVWLLISSGALAQRPFGASLVSFALLAGLTLIACGPRAFWLSALVGHIGSTLATYALLAGLRSVAVGSARGAYASLDYGVSAISAAWLGSIAATAWRAREQTNAGRTAIGLSCLAVGLFAYMMRPGVTVLASEHLLAFGAGIGVTSGSGERDWTALRASVRRLRRTEAGSPSSSRRRFDPFVAAAACVTAVVVGGSLLPTGFAALSRSLGSKSQLTSADCVRDWNAQRRLPGAPAARAGASVVVAAVDRGRRRECSFLVLPPGRSRAPELVTARVRSRAIRWRRHALAAGTMQIPTNATLSSDGTIVLDRQGCAPLRLVTHDGR